MRTIFSENLHYVQTDRHTQKTRRYCHIRTLKSKNVRNDVCVCISTKISLTSGPRVRQKALDNKI